MSVRRSLHDHLQATAPGPRQKPPAQWALGGRSRLGLHSGGTSRRTSRSRRGTCRGLCLTSSGLPGPEAAGGVVPPSATATCGGGVGSGSPLAVKRRSR